MDREWTRGGLWLLYAKWGGGSQLRKILCCVQLVPRPARCPSHQKLEMTLISHCGGLQVGGRLQEGGSRCGSSAGLPPEPAGPTLHCSTLIRTGSTRVKPSTLEIWAGDESCGAVFAFGAGAVAPRVWCHSAGRLWWLTRHVRPCLCPSARSKGHAMRWLVCGAHE